MGRAERAHGGTGPSHRFDLINPTFARLWRAMLLSSIGDWTGIVAVTVLVARLGGAEGGAFAVGAMMVARLVPLVLFGPFAGVMVDRFERRRLMVFADSGRALLYGLLPFVGQLGGIVAISFLIESLALLWGPSLDASLPNVVERDQLARANSINLLTSYGTLPIGAALFTLLVTGTDGGPFGTPAEALPLWVDAATFAVSALIISRLDLGGRRAPETQDGRHRVLGDLAEEWRLLRAQPRIRALILTLVIGFIGVGALTALGPLFAVYTLGVGDAGYGLFITALGVGAAAGIVVMLRRAGDRPRLDQPLTLAMFGLGLTLLGLAATSWALVAGVITLVMGAAAGVAWVSGYTLLQQQVADELRGRTFAVLTVAARAALLTSRALFPFIAGLVGAVAGPRMALAVAGLIVVAGGWTSRRGVASV